MSEKIEELHRLMDKVRVEVIDTNERDGVVESPNLGWFDYVVKYFNGEPATLDWTTIALASVGDIDSVNAFASRYKKAMKFKKMAGLMFESYEDEVAALQDIAGCSIDDLEVPEDFEAEIDLEALRREIDDAYDDDEMDEFGDYEYSDEDLEKVLDAMYADDDIRGQIDDPDSIYYDDLDDYYDYEEMEEQFNSICESISKSQNAHELAGLFRQKYALKESLKEAMGMGDLVKLMRKKMRNGKKLMKVKGAKIKMKRDRAMRKIPSPAKALAIAIRQRKKAMLRKFARVKSDAEYKALDASAKARAVLKLMKIEKNKNTFNAKILTAAKKAVKTIQRERREMIANKNAQKVAEVPVSES